MSTVRQKLTTPDLAISPISEVDHSEYDQVSRSRQSKGSDSDERYMQQNMDSSQDKSKNFESSLDISHKANRNYFNDVNVKKFDEIDAITNSEQSTVSSPVYSEHWDEYSSPRKSAMNSSRLSRAMHRSQESGLLSPSMEMSEIEIGNQPSTVPRFNEPLKLRRGRKFVDFEAPTPTVIYVPNRSFAHGRWTNVAVERKNGRYIVIEQRPVHTQFTEVTQPVKHQYQKDIFGPDTSWVKKKAPWSWSTKGNIIERSVNKGFYEPYLPPLKNKYTDVDSKIGSMENCAYIPGGGRNKIPTFRLKWEADAKVGSLPTTFREKNSPMSSLKLPHVSPRFGASADSGSFTSIHYTPGGNVILRRRKIDVSSQVGSLDNLSHVPSGGNVEIPKNKTKWKKVAKVGSLDNITHLPKNNNVQIFKEKLEWKIDPKVNSLENADYHPKKGKFKVPNFHKNWNKTAEPRIDTFSNVDYTSRGGNAQIIDKKTVWKAKPKVETHWKMNFDYKSLFDDDEDTYNGESISHIESHTFSV